MGYSDDRRKRRNQHRTAAKQLLHNAGGGTFRSVAHWHLMQARWL